MRSVGDRTNIVGQKTLQHRTTARTIHEVSFLRGGYETIYAYSGHHHIFYISSLSGPPKKTKISDFQNSLFSGIFLNLFLWKISDEKINFYFLKMCPIFVGSLHNFGTARNVTCYIEKVMNMWFHAQLAPKILNGIYIY